MAQKLASGLVRFFFPLLQDQSGSLFGLHLVSVILCQDLFIFFMCLQSDLKRNVLSGGFFAQKAYTQYKILHTARFLSGKTAALQLLLESLPCYSLLFIIPLLTFSSWERGGEFISQKKEAPPSPGFWFCRSSLVVCTACTRPWHFPGPCFQSCLAYAFWSFKFFNFENSGRNV